MAPLSPQDDNRSSFERVLDEAAVNAPELDNDLLAPEHRGDNVPPEMSCDPGKQTFYVTSPPEAVRSSSSIKDLPIQGAAPPQKSRTTVMLLVVTVVVLAMAALGIGLGLGLTREKMASDAPYVTTSIARPTSATYTSSSIEPSQTSPTSQHEVMRDTSIAAVHQPNGDQRVFFQEASGNLRQAIYSAKHNIWEANTADSLELVDSPRKLTPLSAIIDLEAKFSNKSISWSVFYVGFINDTIRCVTFDIKYLRPLRDCTDSMGLASVNHVVAANSRHLSVSRLPPSLDLLMVYEDPSGKVNIMHGSHNAAAGAFDFEWHNMTEELDAIINQGFPGSYVTGTCAATDLKLYCFVKDPEVSASSLWGINFAITPGNLTFGDVFGELMAFSSDINDLGFAALAGGQLLWHNQSTLQGDSLDLEKPAAPVPPARFPYQRLGTADVVGGNDSYVYHQINESTIAQEYWDGGPLWLSSGIPIQTEVQNTTAS